MEIHTNLIDMYTDFVKKMEAEAKAREKEEAVTKKEKPIYLPLPESSLFLFK